MHSVRGLVKPNVLRLHQVHTQRLPVSSSRWLLDYFSCCWFTTLRNALGLRVLGHWRIHHVS